MLSLEQQYSIDTELMQHYIAHSDRRPSVKSLMYAEAAAVL